MEGTDREPSPECADRRFTRIFKKARHLIGRSIEVLSTTDRREEPRVPGCRHRIDQREIRPFRAAGRRAGERGGSRDVPESGDDRDSGKGAGVSTVLRSAPRGSEPESSGAIAVLAGHTGSLPRAVLGRYGEGQQAPLGETFRPLRKRFSLPGEGGDRDLPGCPHDLRDGRGKLQGDSPRTRAPGRGGPD